MNAAFGRMALGLILLVAGMTACDETFELNAPYEDIFVVYGVLDPAADSQYVRISLGFQPEEDAIEFAKDYDGAVPDLDVTLVGNGQEISGEFVPNIAKTDPGDFAPTTGAYRFLTADTERLVNGGEYRIEIRKPEQPDFLIVGKTRIPNEPRIISPTRYSFSGEYCLPVVDVEDTVSVLFRRNDEPDNQSAFFEVRWLLRYEEGGRRWELATRPSPVFNRNVRCSLAGVGNLCFSTGNGSVLEEWRQGIPTEARGLPVDVRCSQIPIELSRNAELQVTALDSVLSKYILANQISQVNFNTIRREYTNLSGSARVVGVFGSIAYDNEPFLLTPCAEQYLGLREDVPNCE